MHLAYMNFRSGFAPRSILSLTLAAILLAAATAAAWQYALPPSKLYTDNTYRFSLLIPAAFTVAEGAEIDSDASTTILLQNGVGDGVQILISPWDEPATALTPERITHDTGLTVTDPQPINIQGATGIMFRNDNSGFDGAASDAWFVSRGNIYQLSTYARDDAVLKNMLASWTFF